MDKMIGIIKLSL